MGLPGISETTAAATTILAAQTVSQTGTNKGGGQLNQVQPDQLDQLRAETDTVNFSSKAIELSQSTISNKVNVTGKK